MADDVGITGPVSLQRVHSASEWPIVHCAGICQSESSEMAEDDVLNPPGDDNHGGNGAAAAVDPLEEDPVSRRTTPIDGRSRCWCGIITERRLGVVTSLAFGQGIALIATCMNATAFTLAHTFDVQTQVSAVLLCSPAKNAAHDFSDPPRSPFSFFNSFGCTYSCHFICLPVGHTTPLQHHPSSRCYTSHKIAR
jgi:hypothetical protein